MLSLTCWTSRSLVILVHQANDHLELGALQFSTQELDRVLKKAEANYAARLHHVKSVRCPVCNEIEMNTDKCKIAHHAESTSILLCKLPPAWGANVGLRFPRGVQVQKQDYAVCATKNEWGNCQTIGKVWQKSCQIKRSHGFTIFPMHSASVCSMPWELRYFTADSCSDARTGLAANSLLTGQHLHRSTANLPWCLSAYVGVNRSTSPLFLAFLLPAVDAAPQKFIRCVHPLTSSYFKHGSVLSFPDRIQQWYGIT